MNQIERNAKARKKFNDYWSGVLMKSFTKRYNVVPAYGKSIASDAYLSGFRNGFREGKMDERSTIAELLETAKKE